MHLRLTAGRAPPDRGSPEPRSSGEAARMPRPQRSKLSNNSNRNSDPTMSTEPKQTLTARHVGNTTPSGKTTGNGSSAEDVEKNVADSTRDKNAQKFLQRARGKHLRRIPTIRESMNATLTQSCTFLSPPHLMLGSSR